MRTSRRNDIIVGIFVLVSLAVLFAMTYMIQGSTGRNPYIIRAVFPDVAGLEIGSPVLVSGFRVGRVVQMAAQPGEDGINEVLVVSRVARDIPIYSDAEVRLVQQGFIGDKRLEIRPGTPAAGEISEEIILRSVPQMDLGQAIAEGMEILQDVKVIVGNIARITSDEQRIAAIDNTIKNIESSTRELQQLLAENRAAVRASSENIETISGEFRSASARADSISEKLESTLAEAEAALREFRADRERFIGRIDSVLANVDSSTSRADHLLSTASADYETVAERLKAAIEDVAQIVEKVNRGDGTAGRLINDPAPFDDLQASIESFRSAFLQQESTLYEREISIRRAAP